MFPSFSKSAKLVGLKRMSMSHVATSRPVAVIMSTRFYSADFGSFSAPPRLPKEEQEEFERLQKQANTQVAFEIFEDQTAKLEGKKNVDDEDLSLRDPILLKSEEGAAALQFHPEFRKSNDEFVGDKNPITGEIGGPKQDPLRHGDYSFNGRCTDF
ncbi:DUF1674-domain-containing protein [Nadsonia fulvescens var. elongata DSM 6958]|uniref:Succinate dehydrogenase assembly factor 4, mitochondrial n=1 Tax=Nadsonia fulvescens var. elongata DSM 6958 TaxID=857566 RepID=A0A1E3PHH3_9ASCO|nr:DUF1674-domain-containing protein [Nadsonia fulvescens var. elongata DSM 6958]